MQELNLDSAVRTEELNHLGDLEDWDDLENWKDWGSEKMSDMNEWWWRQRDYCNIPLWITVKNFDKDVVVWWMKGKPGALDKALANQRHRGDWEKLRDSDGVVYFNRNPRPGDKYGTPNGRTADIYDLQKKVEVDPAYFISLVLEIK